MVLIPFHTWIENLQGLHFECNLSKADLIFTKLEAGTIQRIVKALVLLFFAKRIILRHTSCHRVKLIIFQNILIKEFSLYGLVTGEFFDKHSSIIIWIYYSANWVAFKTSSVWRNSVLFNDITLNVSWVRESLFRFGKHCIESKLYINRETLPTKVH